MSSIEIWPEAEVILHMAGTVWVERIPQAVTHQVDAQNNQNDEYAGEDPHTPGTLGDK